MNFSRQANVSALKKKQNKNKKKQQKKTFKMTRDYQSKPVNTIKKKKKREKCSINIMENRQ